MIFFEKVVEKKNEKDQNVYGGTVDLESKYLFIFITREPIPANARSARISAKEGKARRGKKRKEIEAHRVKHPTPSQATDALTREEEQNGR